MDPADYGAYSGETHEFAMDSRLERAAREAALAMAALLLALPASALRGRQRAAHVWLRACTQAGHLWALCGGGYEEYRG